MDKKKAFSWLEGFLQDIKEYPQKTGKTFQPISFTHERDAGLTTFILTFHISKVRASDITTTINDFMTSVNSHKTSWFEVFEDNDFYLNYMCGYNHQNDPFIYFYVQNPKVATEVKQKISELFSISCTKPPY